MDQPVSFQLLGREKSRLKLEGVAMELEDSLYPLLREVTAIHHYRVHIQHSSDDICQNIVLQELLQLRYRPCAW